MFRKRTHNLLFYTILSFYTGRIYTRYFNYQRKKSFFCKIIEIFRDISAFSPNKRLKTASKPLLKQGHNKYQFFKKQLHKQTKIPVFWLKCALRLQISTVT